MKLLTLIFSLLFLSVNSFAVIGSGTVWELRTTGADTNGGGFNPESAAFLTDAAATSATGNAPVISSASYTFVAGDVGAWIYIQAGTNWTPGYYKITSVATGAATVNATVGAAIVLSNGIYQYNTTAGCATTASPTGGTFGVDYSQQDAAQFALTGMTTAGAGSVILTASATNSMIGNVIQITSGTNFTAGGYEITAVTPGVSITVTGAAAAATGVGASGAGNIGGGFLTPSKADDYLVSGNTVYWKSGTYTRTTTWTYTVAGTGALQIYWIGYSTNRTTYNTDTKPLLTTATNSVPLITSTAIIYNIYRNISFSNSAGTRAVFISNVTTTTNPLTFDRCVFDGFSSVLVGTTNGVTAIGITLWACEVKNCTGFAFNIQNSGNSINAYYSYIHNNVGGFSVGTSGNGGNVSLNNCLVANNTARGVFITGTSANCQFTAANSVFYKNTTANIEVSLSAGVGGVNQLTNSIIYGSTDGVKIVQTTDGDTQRRIVSTNAYGGQSGSATINFDAGYGGITLSANPFVDGDNGNFALNNTAGGGTLLRALGYPSLFPGGTTASYGDVGAAQHQDSGVGGGQKSHSY